MRRTMQETLAEVMRRSEQIRARRERRYGTLLHAATGALAVSLVLVVALVPGRGTVAASESSMGALLLSQEAGGYMLTAVIAFCLGVALTLTCLRYRRKSGTSDEVREPRRASGYGRVRLDDGLLGAVSGGVGEEQEEHKDGVVQAQDPGKDEMRL